MIGALPMAQVGDSRLVVGDMDTGSALSFSRRFPVLGDHAVVVSYVAVQHEKPCSTLWDDHDSP